MHTTHTIAPTAKAIALLRPDLPDLKDAMDANARGETDATQLTATLLARCEADFEITWEALSLLDQYHRRGLLNDEAFASAKAGLDALVYGAKRPARHATAQPPPSNVAVESLISETITATERAATPTPRGAEPIEDVTHASSPEYESEHTSEHETVPRSALGSPRAGMLLRDRYVLVAPIATTITSTIFKAFDHQRAGLPEQDCFVSIKCLRDEFTDNADARKALCQEFIRANKLSHPTILSLYDYFQDKDGCFYVMELLQGQMLNHVIERAAPQSIARPQALTIVREIGLALAYAHRQGVIHAHLDPTKIAMTPSGEVRLFGFGAAEESLGSDAALDSVSVPVYRSEQSIRDGICDARDDLFSLACIAYHLLAGHAPFIRIEGRIERTWHRLTNLPKKQWRAIEQALSPTRAQRPENIREWLFAFDATAAYGHTPRSRKTAYIAAGFILLLAGAMIVSWSGFSARQAESQHAATSKQIIDSPTNPATIVEQPVVIEQSGVAEPHGVGDTAVTNSVESPIVAVEPSLAVAPSPIVSPPAIAATAPTKEQAPGKINVGFVADPIRVDEGDATAKVALRRSGSTRRELSVHWRTREGSAQADRDFVATEDGVINFPPGERNAVILVPIVQHPERLYSEWFDVELTGALAADLGPITSTTVVIVSARSALDTEREN